MLTGPNLDPLCIWQLDATPFCENYEKPYFYAKHLEKKIEQGVVKFLVPFFFFFPPIKLPCLVNIGCCPNFQNQALAYKKSVIMITMTVIMMIIIIDNKSQLSRRRKTLNTNQGKWGFLAFLGSINERRCSDIEGLASRIN